MSDRSPTIEQSLQARVKSGGKALVPFLTAGFPTSAMFVAALQAVQNAGCDAVEVGVPFSDPLADGPVIQRASMRSIRQGVTLRRTLDLIDCADVRMPVALMSYLNPLLAHGCRRLTQDAAAVGVRGFVIPDSPWTCDKSHRLTLDNKPQHPTEFADSLRAEGFELIQLAAPTTPTVRLKHIGLMTRGFLYAVTLTGVTGSRNLSPRGTTAFLRRACAASCLPVLAGFGIDSAMTAARTAERCDGVIIGSALLRILQDEPRALSARRLERFLCTVRRTLSNIEGAGHARFHAR